MSNLMDNHTPADAEKLDEALDTFLAHVYEDSCDENRVVRAVVKIEVFKELRTELLAIIDAARNQGHAAQFAKDQAEMWPEAYQEGVENGIKRATGSYSWSMPMKSVRTRNTAFKLYAVKFFNGKIKERREALLLQLKSELSHPAPVHKSDKE